MIAGTTTTMLRAGVTRSCAMQPLLIRTTAAAAATSTCAYSTFPSAPFSIRSKLSPLAPSTKPSSILLHTATPSTRRQASTTSSPGQEDAAAAARAARRAQQQIDPDAPPLDWNTFFQLRKTRRRWQVGFSVVMSLLSGTGGAMVLSTGLADPLTSQVPLDPVMTLGLMTMGFIALGWLAGPTLGSTVFYLMKRKYKGPMTLKESQFFARIKKNRVDPTNSSTGNPVPDFYGEKISSVAGYRRWLKDQRAFNKKRTTFI